MPLPSLPARAALLLAAAAGQKLCASPYDAEACHQSLSPEEAQDPRNRWLRRFFEDGYNVVPQVLTQDQVRRAQRALEGRWKHFPPDPIFGKERQYNILELDPVFGEFLDMIPGFVDEMMQSAMGPWIVGAYDVYKFNPVRWKVPDDIHFNVTRDSIHSDFPYGHSPLPRKPGHWPHTVQLIFMVTDFYGKNGGTITVPGSYRDRLAHFEGKTSALLEGRYNVTHGRRGDMLVYLGGTWHGNSLNVADAARVGVIAQCLPFFFKPMQAQAALLPRRVVLRLSDLSKQRMAIHGHHWFWHTEAGMWMGTRHHRLCHVLDFAQDALVYGYPMGSPPLFRPLSLLCLLALPLGLCCRYDCRTGLLALLQVSLGLVLGVGVCLEKCFVG